MHITEKYRIEASPAATSPEQGPAMARHGWLK